MPQALHRSIFPLTEGWLFFLSQIINAANEVIDSIDKEELAKYFSVKFDPEEDEAEVDTLSLLYHITSSWFRTYF